MRAILDALQEGRLIELPMTGKEDALKLLGAVLEAVPMVPPGTDVVGEVLKRERLTNTAIGQGWACPHARFPFEGQLMCAIGWLPSGTDYGAPDGRTVRIVVMYFIPESEKNTYLKEVSRLARAIQASGDLLQGITVAQDINAIRNVLLDLTTKALETSMPDAQARMIRLDARITEAASSTLAIDLAADRFTALSILCNKTDRPVVLAQDDFLIPILEQAPGLADSLRKASSFQVGDIVLLVRQATSYARDRALYECIAVRPPPAPAAGNGRPPPPR